MRNRLQTIYDLEDERQQISTHYYTYVNDLDVTQEVGIWMRTNFNETEYTIRSVKERVEFNLNQLVLRRETIERQQKAYEESPAGRWAAQQAKWQQQRQQQEVEQQLIRATVDAKFYEWRGATDSVYQWKLQAEAVYTKAASILNSINRRITNKPIFKLAIVNTAVKEIKEYARTAENAAKQANLAKARAEADIDTASRMMWGVMSAQEKMWIEIWRQVKIMVKNASKEYAADAAKAAEATTRLEMDAQTLQQSIEREEQRAQARSQPRAAAYEEPQAPRQAYQAPRQAPRQEPRQEPRQAPPQARQAPQVNQNAKRRAEAAAKQRNANARAEAFMAQEAAKERGASDEAAKKIAERVKVQAAEAADAAAERKKEREEREQANAERARQNAVNAKQYGMPKTKEEAAKVLGIPIGADRKTVMKAYKEKAMLSHPDKEGGKAEWFKQVGQAFSIMKGS